MQVCSAVSDGKEETILHFIIYMSRLFTDSQIKLAAQAEEVYNNNNNNNNNK